MPAVQATPPGHLELHVVVVALTPALLVAVAGAGAGLSGGGRVARGACWIGMLAAFAIEALFLLPQGLAAAFTFPIGHGWLRVGTFQVACSLAAGLAALLYWRPRLPEPHAGWSGWGWRTALCLAMPLALVPALGLLAGADAPPAPAGAGSPAWRRWRVLGGLLATVLVASTLAVDDGDRWLPRLAAALGYTVVAALAGRPWRPGLLFAALAALLPLPADSALGG